MSNLPIKTIADIRNESPCYDPAKYLPEDWSGTALDILRVEDCLAVDRLWVVLREGWIGDTTLRLFACDCAERVLPLFEKKFPEDKRPHQAIEVARRYAEGDAADEELRAAQMAAWAVVTEASWAARATGWAADAAAENAACMARDAVEGVEDAAVVGARSARGAGAVRATVENAGGATLEEARGREAQWQVDALIKRLEGNNEKTPIRTSDRGPIGER